MRVKEGSDDYRYFPEPDLVELYIDDAWKEEVRASIPELPDARKARYVAEIGLPAYDAHVLTLTKEMSDFFEAAIADGADAKLTSNWLMGEVLAYLNKQQKELKDVALTPAGLSKMVQLIEKGTISSKIAKKVFNELIEKVETQKKSLKRKVLFKFLTRVHFVKL